MKKEIVIATRNKKKFNEIKRLFRGSGISILSLDRFPEIPEVIEDGKTFNDNAAKKALVISRFTDKLVVADDSGLEVDALKGKPGVHSARYAGPKKRNRDNMEKLLRALSGKNASKRAAQFRCVIAVASKRRLIKLVEGSCVGRIGLKIEGDTGFGYDPVFIPRGYKKSFADLGSRLKDKVSHRGKAFRRVKKFIEGYFSKGF